MLKSLPSKALLFFLLLATGIVFSSHTSLPKDCDDIELKVEVTPSSIPGKGNIEATISGATKSNCFVFTKDKSGLLSLDFTKRKFDNLDAGTYACTVYYNKGCSKKIEFKIE